MTVSPLETVMNKIILNAGAAPRALVGTVRAEGDPRTLLTELNGAFTDFRQRNDARLDGIEAALDEQSVRSAAHDMNGRGFHLPVDRNYSDAFAGYFRKGDNEQDLKQANAIGYRATVHAAMSVNDPSSGGYLSPIEWDRRVQEELRVLSPMRRIADVRSTTTQAYSTLWNNGGFASGWVGETAARPETATASLDPIEFPAGEIYANPAITQRLLDDADFDVAGWLSSQVAQEFAIQEGIAFITGNGVNKPSGLLTYAPGGVNAATHPGGALVVENSGDADSLGVDDAGSSDRLVQFLYNLATPYRRNGTFLMNSQTASVIARLKNGSGDYIWRDGFKAGEPALLLGRPVEIDETMPGVAAGQIPIAFGDFKRGYVINDRLSIRVLRDPYTAKPYVMFYTTKRVGGGVMDPNAIRLLKISA